MVRAFVLVIATAATLGGCASLGFGPTGYQAGKYTTEEPYEYGYWESCAHALTYSTRCKVYYLASRETEEDAMWHMAIYRAAEVGDDAGFRYLSWSLPKIRPVSKLGFGSMYHWGNSAEIEVTFFRELPPFRSDERAAVGQIYEANAILEANRDNPASGIPLEAVVTGAEYRAKGLM